jgi:predicted metal-dependent peptidase
MNEPFFAAISRRVNKASHDGVPAAGVRVNPDSAQFELLYNPAFFAGLTDVQRADVLKHEFYHLVLEHVTGRMPTGEDHKRWNFATDLAINSHLSNLPEGCLMPGEGPFADLQPGQAAEWYLSRLPETPDGGGCNGDCQPSDEGDDGEGGSGNCDCPGPENGQFDSHDDWGGSGSPADNAANEIAKERIKDIIQKAANEAQKANSWGSVSAGIRKEILERLTPRVDWKKVLRYFIKTSQKANKSSTVRRLNKRFPYIHPGRKVNRQAKIAISIDQSGSVDDGMLATFFAELNKLASLAEFTVIPFDSEVAEDKVYVWKKDETRPWERVRYGGTDFNPPTQYVNERNFDGHIILTDLCAPKPIASKAQRMWMTTKYYADNPYFRTTERVIAIEDGR